MKGIVFGLAVFVLPLSVVAEVEDVASLLFQEFAAKCSSQGLFTQRVLSETRSLQRILEKIKNDPDCEDLVPVLDSIIPLTQQLPLLDQGIADDQQHREMDQYIERLSHALALSRSSDEQALLSTEIASYQFKLKRRTYERDEALRIARARTVQAVADYADQLSKYANASLCFERHKTLPFQLAGSLLSLSGGFFGPVVNTAMVVSGRLFQSFFSYISSSSIVREIKKYRESGMWMGLSCAMEALENTQCDIQDQRNLIQVQREIRWGENIPAEWTGYDIMTRDYDVIKNFFQAIKSGAGASSGDQGSKISELKSREGSYQGIKFYIEGLTRDAEKKVAQAGGDATSEETAVKTLIDTLVYAALGYYGREVAEGSKERLYLWLRIGNAYPILPNNTTLDQFIDMIKGPSNPYINDDAVVKRSIPLVSSRMAEIVDVADKQLEIDKKITISSDPRRTMSFFSDDDGVKSSPEMIWIRIMAYLEALETSWYGHPEYFLSPSAQELQLLYLAETKKLFLDSFQILRDPALTDDDKLKRVSDILKLKDDDLYLTNRMVDHVDTDLDIKIRLGILRDKSQFETVARISATKLINTLTPSGSIADLEADLDKAEQLAFQNLKNFSETFGESIENALDLLDQNYVDAGSVPGSIFSRNYANLCALTLNFPKISSSLKKKCQRQRYGLDERGFIEYGWNRYPLVVDFDEMVSRPYKERVCAYRRYVNERKLIEIFKNRPSPFLVEEPMRRRDGTVSIHKFYR